MNFIQLLKYQIALVMLLTLIGLNSQAIEIAGDSNNDEFLDIDDAFKVSLIEDSNKSSSKKIEFSIAEGHYLYKKNISINVAKPATISHILFPQAEIKDDANFGRVEIYHRYLMLPVEINTPSKIQTPLEIQVNYQGCSEKGLCYPPTSKVFISKTGLSTTDFKDLALDNIPNTTDSSQQSGDGTALLQSGNFWLIVLGFFGFGLLLSLTPCVFPMIPILSGIIVGQENASKGHIFILSLAYTLGMSFSYTAAGILAALTGNLISSMLQSPWVLGSFALIFVLLAFSMFGFYELQLPASMSTNLTQYSNRLKAGKFIGVFAMGALSALIVSPCVAAPLAGALIFISKTHDIFLGGTALFALSMGMGVPLLIIGASAGVLLPKAGNWMNAVKNIFGVLMLALAIWIVSPILNQTVTLFLYAILIIISSVYLGAFESIPTESSGWIKLKKGIALVLFITGVLVFFNAHTNYQARYTNQAGNVSSVNKPYPLSFKKVTTESDFIEQLNQSKGKYLMLDFYADWCTACKEYEQTTFKDPSVVEALKQFTLLQIDVTANTAQDKKLLQKFSLYGPPGIVFFDKSSQQIFKIVGYQDPEKFYSSINQVLSN